MNIVEIATTIAKKAHDGQLDKAGNPYIEHPLKIAANFEDDERIVAALLHDVIEDSEMTTFDLINLGIPENIVEVVRLLTKDKETDYFDYLEKIKNNSIARDVKLADLSHNMDLKRIKEPKEKDYKRCKKYKLAYEYLNG